MNLVPDDSSTGDGLVIDLFAGPGGWDEGMAQLGIRNVVGVEWDPTACATAEAAGHKRIQADVSTLDPAQFGDAWGLIGSPPCTTLSMAGHRGGQHVIGVLIAALNDLARGDDTREVRRAEATAQLLAAAEVSMPDATDEQRTQWAERQAAISMQIVEPFRYALALRPEWIALEQVPAALPIWRHLAHLLRGVGYSAWTAVLNAADYGVPQTRQRAILGAHLNHTAAAPVPTHAKDPGDGGLFGDLFGSQPARWVSMADALGWGMTAKPSGVVTSGGGSTGGAEPFGNQTRKGMEREQAGGNWILHTNRDQRPDGSRQTVGTDRPAPAVTAKSGGQWTLDRRTNSAGAGGSAVPVALVPADRPAPTVTGLSGNQWVFRSGQSVAGEGRAERAADKPAVTITGRADLCSWVHDRPATTVQGDPRVGRPGHKDREGGEAQFERDSVKITVAEAATLQSFRPDYPWRGTKTKQFEQVGNAVPPRLAAHVVAALTGRTYEPDAIAKAA